MVEVTIEITQKCFTYCKYCSSDASPTGKHLSGEKIKEFLNKLDSPSIERINISGGEPLMHPDFWNILQHCRAITKNVWVYTNALDKIIYNSDVIKEIDVEANVVVIPGKEVYIPCKVDRVHLLKLIYQGRAKRLPEGLEITVSRNFWDEEHCKKCNYVLLQADGQVVEAPCKKSYH